MPVPNGLLAFPWDRDADCPPSLRRTSTRVNLALQTSEILFLEGRDPIIKMEGREREREGNALD